MTLKIIIGRYDFPGKFKTFPGKFVTFPGNYAIFPGKKNFVIINCFKYLRIYEHLYVVINEN